MTLIDAVRSGRQTGIVKRIAKSEGVPAHRLAADIRKGLTVIPKNRGRRVDRPCGIGRGLSTKVNVNIGTSPDSSGLAAEIGKLKASVELGADTVMDLSVGKNVRNTRLKILEKCPVPLGTVPVYEAAVRGGGDMRKVSAALMLDVLKEQARDGVDFFTVHAGINRKSIGMLRRSRRIIDMVSRGGALIYRWMTEHGEDNPFYTRFDEVLDIVREHDVTLSLGDGLRPGAIADANDAAQFGELRLLGVLQRRALKKGVQVIIEGPGHVPMDAIEKNILLEKRLCHGAPFYVLGPLVTDIAPGYDHITAAIGGALAAKYGADFLCYVTPAEHLRLPDLDDVREGVIASKIAAHAADIAKGRRDAWRRDSEFSTARNKRDWEKQFSLALDARKPKRYRGSSRPNVNDVCTMCGQYCPMKITQSGGNA
ncbi:MAG: phosphomethylpyrimidine synthase ThiC [Candidatus Omnitrophota bacterium]